MSAWFYRTAGMAVLLGLLPGGTAAQEERQRAFPADVAARVVDFYNRDGTTRLSGETSIGAGSEMVGDVAVLGGPVTLEGIVKGDLLVINGELKLLPGAEVTGSILVVGGSVKGLPAAKVAGGVVV
jgi:hypothetical protein